MSNPMTETIIKAADPQVTVAIVSNWLANARWRSESGISSVAEDMLDMQSRVQAWHNAQEEKDDWAIALCDLARNCTLEQEEHVDANSDLMRADRSKRSSLCSQLTVSDEAATEPSPATGGIRPDEAGDESVHHEEPQLAATSSESNSTNLDVGSHSDHAPSPMRDNDLAVPASEIDLDAQFLSSNGLDRQITVPGSQTLSSDPLQGLDLHTKPTPFVDDSLFGDPHHLFNTPNLDIEVADPQKFPVVANSDLQGISQFLESFLLQPSTSTSCNSEFLEIVLPQDTMPPPSFDLSWFITSFEAR